MKCHHRSSVLALHSFSNLGTKHIFNMVTANYTMYIYIFSTKRCIFIFNVFGNNAIHLPGIARFFAPRAASLRVRATAIDKRKLRSFVAVAYNICCRVCSKYYKYPSNYTSKVCVICICFLLLPFLLAFAIYAHGWACGMWTFCAYALCWTVYALANQRHDAFSNALRSTRFELNLVAAAAPCYAARRKNMRQTKYTWH